MNDRFRKTLKPDARISALSREAEVTKGLSEKAADTRPAAVSGSADAPRPDIPKPKASRPPAPTKAGAQKAAVRSGHNRVVGAAVAVFDDATFGRLKKLAENIKETPDRALRLVAKRAVDRMREDLNAGKLRPKSRTNGDALITYTTSISMDAGHIETVMDVFGQGGWLSTRAAFTAAISEYVELVLKEV